MSRNCATVVFVFAFFVLTYPANAEDAPSDYRAQLLAYHNAVRADAKLPALTHDALLSQAAKAHANHMAKTGKFAHDGIGDGKIDERIDAAGYNWKKVGENIAWSGNGTADNTRLAMQIWLASPPHKMQILSEIQEVGFGRAVGADGKVYWVACFGTPAP